MYVKRSHRALAWILSICLVITLIPELGFAASSKEDKGKTERIAPEDVTEKDVIEEEKTTDSTTYDLGGGEKMTVFHGGEVRYEKEEGKLVDYDPSLVKVREGEKSEQNQPLKGYSYENKEGDKKQYLPKTLSEKTPILMEYKDYRISFAPTDETMEQMGAEGQTVEVEKETIPTTYEQDETLPINAAYGGEGRTATLTYTSGDQGVKETLTLDRRPKSNVFQYNLELKGMTARKNVTDEGITYYDKKTGDIAGFITAPWMNDASGDAYSEEITYDLKKDSSEEDAYLLTMTVSEDYLSDPERKYPVTIDPSNTWKGSAKVKDAYVISGSKYGNTNFYESGTKVMPAGKNSTGTHRTFIKFTDLTKIVNKQSVTSAKLTVWETGSGASKQKVGIRRVKETWALGGVTWNNRPSLTGTIDTITTKKTANSAHTFDVLSFVKGLSTGSFTNYGLALNNETASPSYACFYGSRTSSSSHRPKLEVTYYSKPTTASSASISPGSVKTSTAAKINYAGITSTGLNRVEYRVDRVTCGTARAAYWGYASTRKINTAAALPSLPNGCYQFYVRGVNNAGTAGGEKGTGVVHVDNAVPTLTLTGPATTAAAPSGTKSPVIKWSAADTHLSTVKYSADGSAYKSVSASGSTAIHTFTTSGAHTITMQAADSLGNTATKSFTYYLDITKPSIGTVGIKTKDKETLGADWTDDENPLIRFDGIKDNVAITPANIQYAIVKKGTAPVEANYKAITFETISSAMPFSGTFRLTAADQKLPSGAYEIHLRVKDKAGNSEVKSLAFNRDNEDPTAKLKVMSHSSSQAISEVKDVVTVTADLDGTGSPIKEAKLDLFRIKGDSGEEEYIETLKEDITQGANVEWDTTTLDNGSYRLKASVKDSAGLTGTDTYDVKIVNQLAAPKITADPIKENPLKVSWEFAQSAKIKELQYKLKDAEDWTSVPDSASASGQLEITLPGEGDYEIQFRGVDTAGVDSKTTAKTCIYDTAAPVAEIQSFARGRVKGTASDEHLKEWKLFCKEKDEEDSAYRETLSGTEEVKNGQLGILDLTDTYFKNGHNYQIKLVVTDAAGNETEALDTFYKAADETCIKVEEAKFHIKRPSWYAEYRSDSFTLASQTKKLELKELEEDTLKLGSFAWYIDNRKAGEERTLDKDFSTYKEGDAHRILAIHESESGQRSYSRRMIGNDQIKTISLGEGPASSSEKSLTVNKDVVSLRLAAEPETESGEPIRYTLKAADGAYTEIKPGKTYYVTELKPGSAYASEFTVKAACDTETAFDDVKLELDTLEAESFTISTLCDYLPENASVKSKLNDRAYLYWDSKVNEEDTEISYNVYHSADKEFVPSEETLAAENVKAGYYSEINVNYGGDYYYRITAVKRNGDGKLLSESIPSKVFGGRILDYNEHTKRLGLQDYWQYEDFNNPVGSGSIEKSSGNFVYQQTDATLPNEKLEVDLTRTYNSQSSEKSAFGLGWNHNYDLQLLNVYDKETDRFDNVVFKDSTGTILRFVKDEKDSDTYISSMGEYITMKKEPKTEEVQIPEKKAGAAGENQMKTVQVASQYTVRTKDNLEYRFNGGGQLVYLTEPNGSFLLFEYQEKIGLLERIVTNKNLAMEFTYNSTDPDADLLLVEKIGLPDGSTREYSYKKAGTSSLLAEVEAVGADGEKILYQYDYDNADNPNVCLIRDAKGSGDSGSREYRLAYDEEKVAEAIYPNSDKLTFTYGKGENGSSQTVIKKLADKRILLGYREVSRETGLFNRDGYCTESTDVNGNKTTYSYEDGICTQTSWKTDSTYIADDGAIRSKGEVSRTELTELGARRNAVQELNEDGSIATYVYYADTSDVILQDLVRSEKSLDADGELESENYYDYDELGNEIEDYDAAEDLTTISDYDEDGELERETEYYVGDLDYDVDMDEGQLKEVVRTTSYAYAYDDKGNKTETMTEVCDNKKTETVTTYDIMGNEVRAVIRSGAAGQSLGEADIDSATETKYDGFGRAVKTTTKDGGITTVTENSYDANGTLQKETTATTENGKTDTVTTTYAYDKMNNVTSKTVDDNGQTTTTATTYGYQDVDIHSSTGSRKETVHDAYVVTETDEDGSILSQTYQDKAGNTVREKQNGLYTDTLYDRYGKAVGTYEAGKNEDSEDGLLTLNVYDENGSQTDTVIRPELREGTFYAGEDSIRQSTKYSAAGKETASIDPLGNKTTYGYDQKGNLNKVTLPDGSATSYETKDVYVNGALEQKVVTTDAKGQISETRQSGSGEQLEIKDVYKEGETDQSIWTKYTYDDKGRLEKEAQAKGNYKRYYYDANDRVSEIGYYEKVDGKEKQTLKTTYAYDVAGNVTKMCDYTVAGESETLYRYTAYTYNKQKQLVAFSECDGPEIPTREQLDACKISYTYNKDGKLTDLDYAIAKDGVTGLTYQYDSNKWLTSIRAKGGLLGKTLREYTYDDHGKVSQMKDYYGFAEGGNGAITRDYTYDAFGRVTSMTYTDSKDADQPKESYEYQYDKNSNILEEKIVSNYVMADGKGINCTKSYTYDNVGRLKTVDVADQSEGAQASKDTEYSYDKVGNRVKETVAGEITSYTYNGLNQLTSSESKKNEADGEAVTSKKTYQYDRNGNQTGQSDSVTKESAALAYDAANRLSRYEGKNDKATVVTQENRYNGDGQRIQKKETQGSESKTYKYYYQDETILYTMDDSNKLTSLNLIGTGGNVIATERKGEGSASWYLYNKDVRESTTSMINSAGELAKAYEYDEFGETTVKAGESFYNEIGYTGQIYDDSTGLYYYNARFYDPEDGRFISQDTYRGENKKPDTLHLYTYCANNPVNYVDPTGHFAWVLPVFGAISSSSMVNFIVGGIGASVLGVTSGLSLKNILKVVESVKVAKATVSTLLKTLTKAVKKSWKRKRNKKNEKHHIIAKTAKKAAAGRQVLKNASIGINSERNLKTIKYNLHKHIHADPYYWVTSSVMVASSKVGPALRKAFPKKISKKQVTKINSTSAKATLKALKLLIGVANIASKR